MPLAPIVVAILGAAGAVAVARLLLKTWRSVNAELHPQDAPGARARGEPVEREKLPKLKRDPQTGVYRAG
jgi:hypothetical protein